MVSTNFTYLYSFRQNAYRKWYEKELKKKDNIKYEIISEATIFPITIDLSQERPDGKKGVNTSGVFDANKNYVDYSGHKIFDINSKATQPAKSRYLFGKPKYVEAVDFRDYECVYLGPIQNQWGHFISDFVSRLWICDIFPKMKKVFSIEENQLLSLAKPIKSFLSFFDKEIEFINHPTRYRSVVVPEQSYLCGVYYSDLFLDTFKRVTNKVIREKTIDYYPVKLFLDRRMTLETRYKEYGLEVFSELLSKNGYFSINPGNTSLEEMILYMNNADEIATFSGTDAHNVLLINSTSEKEMIIFNKSYHINIRQRDYILMKGLKTLHCDVYDALAPVSHGTGPFLVNYSDECRKLAENRKWKQPSEKWKAPSNIKRNVNNYLSKIQNNKIMTNFEEGQTDFFQTENQSRFLRKYLDYFKFNNSFEENIKEDVNNNKKNRKIALWGAGNNGKNFINNINLKIDIIIDKKTSLKSLNKIKVFNIDDIDISDYYFIISIYNSMEIEEWLNIKGLKEMEDYICFNRYV